MTIEYRITLDDNHELNYRVELDRSYDPAAASDAPRWTRLGLWRRLGQRLAFDWRMACGNEVLGDTVRTYWQARHGPIFSRLGDYFENPASWSAALVEHDAVLEAIRARDPNAARDAMHQHLKKATSRYSASWRRANQS